MTRRPTSKERGLGWEHVKARRAALANLVEGTPCPRCGLAMSRDLRNGWQAVLDLDHMTPRALGGSGGPALLSHAWCNRSAGGKLRAQIAKAAGQTFESRW